ncbi:MAG: bifunctional diaminohydroxyphosphoribosylaminopyrimidine deaminase/5-amino-6-(5-phosphoribosylamino)uracil reductase RibD [Candidatus Omnitrophica bacterium]|nr:bifunctional diaminohydroxyphosphoribosylaminopyrimidine deaminase/5-amino-6-(5-phosphoribosylamino)uracil reductase RibD [Candidatus Omnitrophota bacterium]
MKKQIHDPTTWRSAAEQQPRLWAEDCLRRNARWWDEYWMRRAFVLAEKGRGKTSPNPVVGVCLVKKNRLISEGFHTHFGGPHAEAEAIRKARKKAKSATLYVTLEPCSTYGKTPPCTEAIRKAGIRRVIIGAIDPNPRHHGRAISLLKKWGIQVQTGVLKKDCERQNEAFFKWVRTGLPLVTLKMAQSLDGKIASRTGKSKWISGPEARQWVHVLRASQDAVLVGKNTVLRDDPRLTVRNGKVVREPWRIVLDEKGAISPRARIFRSQGPVLLVCSEKFLKQVAKKFHETKATILPLPSSEGRLDLGKLLRRLAKLGITSLLVEGGGEVAWSFIEQGLVNQVKWVIAPKLIGGRDAKTSIEGLGVGSLMNAPLVSWTGARRLGDDILLEGNVRN